MLKKMFLVTAALVTLLGLIACEPGEKYVIDGRLVTEEFDNSNAWENYEDEAVKLAVEEGVYLINNGPGGYIWGLNEMEHQDVVIEVEVTQRSTEDSNGFGVMCRADTSNNGDGYYFLIGGDGTYAIAKGEGDDINNIVDWATSSAINKGQATNKIRAACIGDKLYLHVNDRFVAETQDSSYSSGYAGFAAGLADGETGEVTVAFDHLKISEGKVLQEQP